VTDSPRIDLALVLSLHQPPWNLEHLLEADDIQAREILWAMDRIPRSLWRDEDLARVHVAPSGTLLETLASPDFQQRVYGIVDCGSLLWHLQNTRVIELLGTAYYHPVLPLIPQGDWEQQLERWQGIGRHLFARRFEGFWPPELGFEMELIPALRRHGYRWTIVDSEHVEPLSPMTREELCYQPHLAELGGERIVVVVRDRDLSQLVADGLEADAFVEAVRERTRGCGFTPLVTVASHGENGAWFRDPREGANFWSGFHAPLIERIRRGDGAGIRPSFISAHLERHAPAGLVAIGPGTGATDWHAGTRYVQWAGSQPQRDALTRIGELSQAVHAARRNAFGVGVGDRELYRRLEQALWRVLRAETSCNFFWGEAWVARCHQDLYDATGQLEAAGRLFG
jgi:4-alpha-glucanotransferase